MDPHVRPDPFAVVADEEERLAAACAALSYWLPELAAGLHALAAEHRAAAQHLAQARPRRWRARRATVRATMAAALGSDLGVLEWLRALEQRLLDRYVDLEADSALGDGTREHLRRVLVPAAFERFVRVDQWIMLREEQGAYA
jgi:hypothetical protein